MTAPGIEVRPEELIKHAGSVAMVSHEVQRASDGAKTNSLNDDVFGIILSFVVSGWFNEKEQDITKKYTDMVEALDGDSENLRSASQTYVASDDFGASTLGSVNTGLDLPL
jgi:Excreted virulence factor EspC, type VII ESX diderm